MARASLIFRYQWRAFWRRVLRTGRVKFYLTVLALLGWMTAAALPDRLSRAARELAAGQTASMDRLLAVLCLLWLVVLGEDLNVSLSNDRLRRFPIDVRSLLALKLFVALPAAARVAGHERVSCLASLPFSLRAIPCSAAWRRSPSLRSPLVSRVSVSQSLGIARRRRRLLFAAAALGAAVLAFAVASLQRDAGPLSASLIAANPATLVTTIAVATTPSAIIVPVATLLVSGAAGLVSTALELYPRPLRRCARADSSPRNEHRLASRAFGSSRPKRATLYPAPVLDLWVGLLPVLAAVALALSTSLSSTFRQTIFVMVCALNANVTLNCLGLDRPAGLTRYLILPIRGKDLFLAKNVGVMVLVALQLMALVAIGAWQSGVIQFGADIVVVIVLLLAHFAWGNVVSVFEPRRAEAIQVRAELAIL